jgi:predicted lipoprotein with Yx(FWY)xxD motif
MVVDANGMTLYVFKKDKVGVSNCAWECAKKWPIFYEKGLASGNFSSIERVDGNLQTTYTGLPLYYFSKDTKPWDMLWHKVKNVWFIADEKLLFVNPENAENTVDDWAWAPEDDPVVENKING